MLPCKIASLRAETMRVRLLTAVVIHVLTTTLGPLCLLTEGQRMLTPRGQSGGSVKLTTDLHLIPCLERVEFYHRAHYFMKHAIYSYIIIIKPTGCTIFSFILGLELYVFRTVSLSDRGTVRNM